MTEFPSPAARTAVAPVEAHDAGACWIMLDNMPVADIEMVVKSGPSVPTPP
jgi:nicotinate-nucleotide pyrophosphorylase